MELPADKKIILFDGVCNLCDGVVTYVLRHDKRDVFRFAPLQSEAGQAILRKLGLSSTELDSIILYEPGKAYYYKSAAAIEIARSLGGFFTLSGILKIIPKGIRNAVYDYIARNRYRWYGKKDACMIPTPEIRFKFLS
jgi:predicted DCC family thiol-disulfide oxidoreductase YuxK